MYEENMKKQHQATYDTQRIISNLIFTFILLCKKEVFLLEWLCFLVTHFFVKFEGVEKQCPFFFKIPVAFKQIKVCLAFSHFLTFWMMTSFLPSKLVIENYFYTGHFSLSQLRKHTVLSLLKVQFLCSHKFFVKLWHNFCSINL